MPLPFQLGSEGNLSLTLAQSGAAALLVALVLAGFAVLLSVWSGLSEDPLLARVGRRSLYACAGAVVLASAALETALLSHDFKIAFVTEHTDRSLSWPLLAAAFYGGQEGSMLYWTLIITVLGSAALAAAGRGGVRLQSYATGVLALLAGFFLTVLVFVASPFDLLPITPPDGLGLNPVLRDGGMLIHPPFLLAGFASFAIPFAFAMASLLAGRQDAVWISLTGRVALLAWGLQSTGLVLGMWWAYHVLGWGGYWGWDPVENLALLPWLATTAYIHSAQVQERRGQLRAWNHGLVVLAFLLSIFGTFIVRSGIVQSVHSFAVSPIGGWFFGLLVVCVVASGAALAIRSRSLGPDRPLESPISREGAFLLQNFLLVALLGAILWGTVLPLVSGLFGAERVVGPSYYERVSAPLFVAVLLLLAAGPMLPWRRAGAGWLRVLRTPAIAAAIALLALAVLGSRQPWALVVMPLLAAGAATCLTEYARGARFARHLAGPWPLAAVRLMARNRRRYGAYLAHLGLIVLAAGMAGSHLWQQRFDVVVPEGGTVVVAGYQLQYLGLTPGSAGDHTELVAQLRLGDEVLQLARLTYAGLGGQSLTRVAIRSTPREDLYVVLAGIETGQAAFTVFVNPMVTWIWAGALILIAGILAGNLGGLAPRPAREWARAGVAIAAR